MSSEFGERYTIIVKNHDGEVVHEVSSASSFVGLYKEDGTALTECGVMTAGEPLYMALMVTAAEPMFIHASSDPATQDRARSIVRGICKLRDNGFLKSPLK